MRIIAYYLDYLKYILKLDGIPSLLIRIYLAPIFIIAGYNKSNFNDVAHSGLSNFLANENVIAWFGNTDWGLGLPFPEILANLTVWVELFGGWLLLFGLFTRLVSIPLMFTMFIAASTVHIDNGWFAITPTNGDTSTAQVFTWFGFDTAQTSIENSEDTAIKLNTMRELVEEHGNAQWLYSNGNIVVLNNGIEFAATYFILLLALFFLGAGRYTSIDFYLFHYFTKKYTIPAIK